MWPCNSEFYMHKVLLQATQRTKLASFPGSPRTASLVSRPDPAGESGLTVWLRKFKSGG